MVGRGIFSHFEIKEDLVELKCGKLIFFLIFFFEHFIRLHVICYDLQHVGGNCDPSLLYY